MIFTNSDGGSRGNPGEGAIGVIVRNENKIIAKHSEKIGTCTNNIAEYQALIKALELAGKHTNGEITCFLDSELVVKQLLGEYRVKNEKILPLFLKIQKLQENFAKVKYVYVSRWDKYQQIADELLNDELGKKKYSAR